MRLVAAAATTAATLVALSPIPANAATGDWSKLPGYCGNVKDSVGLTKANGSGSGRFANGKYQAFGTDIPIILIHGYGGMNKGQWGSLQASESFSSRLNSVSGAKVATEFQYDTGVGVYDTDYEANFQPFANTIDCFARMSKNNGGIGKVIIVSYSQGSSTAHGASVLRSADGKRKTADQIGQVISIADARIAHPLGSVNSYFGTGYPAPKFPKSITSVHTIAGNVAKVARNKKGEVIKTSYTNSDDVIRVNNAIRQYTDNWDSGGGNFVASCFREYSSVQFTTMTKDAPCRHGALLEYQPVQENALAAVRAYMDSLTPSTTRTWTIANKLTVHLDESWGTIASATGQEVEGYANELGTRREIQIDGSGYPAADPDSYMFGGGSWVKTGPGLDVRIGGRTPDYTASFYERTSPVFYGNAWCFTSDGICVYHRGALSASDAATPSAALQKVFDTATWSN